MSDEEKSSLPAVNGIKSLWNRRTEVLEQSSGLLQGARDQAGELSSQAGSWLSKSGRSLSDYSQGLWQSSLEAGEQTVDYLCNVPEMLQSKIFTDCTVPAFLLPLGPDKRQYQLVFDFDDAIERLESGLLIRPRLQLWSPYQNVDTNELAVTLKKEFTRQYRERIEVIRQQHQDKVDELNQQITDLEQKKSGFGAIGDVLNGMLLLAERSR